MRSAVVIGVVSVLGAAWMIRSAIAVGFAIFIGPIVLAELVLIAALYALWRGFGGAERVVETVEAARPADDRSATRVARPPRAAGSAARAGVPRRSLVGRTGG